MPDLEEIRIALPTGSYKQSDPRASGKQLINVFSEINPQTAMADTKQLPPQAAPITLRRWAGIQEFATDNSTHNVRGIWEMLGVVYVVIGPTLYSMASNGHLTQLGTGIGGMGLVRMCDNMAVLFILVPNSYQAWVYAPDNFTNGTATSKFGPFTDSTFLTYGAKDVWFVDSYFVFLAVNGRLFYNDDGQSVSGFAPPTFTSGGVFPREFGTDLFVGMCVDHREVLIFGERTSEGYVNAGNPTFSPFASAPDSFMQIGCHPDAGLSIALQDQSVFWVANDRTVRRRNGQTPVRVSNSGIEAILEHANLKGCYAFSPSIAGHPLWVLTMPAEGRTIAYDALTTEWFEIESYGLGYWRVQAYLNILGKQFVGDSQSSQLGYLDTKVFAEFGQPLVAQFVTQSVYKMHHRVVHRRLELVTTGGRDPNYGGEPLITLYKSNNSGATYTPDPMRGLGKRGARQDRVIWFNLGISRDRNYKFLISDPTELFTVDITADIQIGNW